MFESGGSVGDVRRSGEAAAHPVLSDLRDSRTAANKADAARVHLAYDLLDVRLCTEADIDDLTGRGSENRALRAAVADVSDALALAPSVTNTMLTVGEQLWHRCTVIDAAFTAGELDYARVSAICLIMAKASSETVAALEGDILARATEGCTPTGLREALWAMWFDLNFDEANEARDAAVKASAGVRRKTRTDGLTDSVITSDRRVGDEFVARIAELVATVCPSDPRTRGELEVAAVSAMVNEQNAIACLCGSADCSFAGADIGTPRDPLFKVDVPIDYLIGLMSTPPTLPDGTPLDPAIARTIAESARWQGFLSEMVDLAGPLWAERVAQQHARQQNPKANADPAPQTTRANPDAPQPDPDTDTDTDTDTIEPVIEPDLDPDPDSDDPEPLPLRPRARRFLARGRRRDGAPIPHSSTPPQPRPPRLVGWDSALRTRIAELHAEITADPDLARGIFPDGHGHYLSPPPGALTYKPSAELKDRITAQYRTCVAPGCSVPSEKCQLDHVVPFDRRTPAAGGWTIEENLRPLCRLHHQIKTDTHWSYALLADGFACWTLPGNHYRITAPAPGMIVLAKTALDTEDDPEPDGPFRRKKVVLPLPDDLDEPTWWERHHLHHQVPDHLTAAAIAKLEHTTDRDIARRLRNHYLQHKAVLKARAAKEKPPF